MKKEQVIRGGVISCVIQDVPAGIGEPVFDKLQADLAKACMSINAAHGFDYGSGFAAGMKGSEHNDLFDVSDSGNIRTTTNFSGGIQEESAMEWIYISGLHLNLSQHLWNRKNN